MRLPDREKKFIGNKKFIENKKTKNGGFIYEKESYYDGFSSFYVDF